jgi:PAS domain S-box-containing protein
MSSVKDAAFTNAIERGRVESLYASVPSSIVSVMIGISVVFLLLSQEIADETMRAWAAFMLSATALRGWLWMRFRSMVIPVGGYSSWEWGCALTMGLTGLGWGALFGPLFPNDQLLRMVIWILPIVVANTGFVLAASSRLSFVLFIIPTLLPGMWRFLDIYHFEPKLVISCGCFLGVMAVLYMNINKLFSKHLAKRVFAEQLLTEQQAILYNTSVGIAVFEQNKLLKCNPRFAEIFGRNLQASTDLEPTDFFMKATDAQSFVARTVVEFAAGRPFRSIERLRRADGSEVFGEISGRRMMYGDTARALWMIDEVPPRQEEGAHA